MFLMVYSIVLGFVSPAVVYNKLSLYYGTSSAICPFTITMITVFTSSPKPKARLSSNLVMYMYLGLVSTRCWDHFLEF